MIDLNDIWKNVDVGRNIKTLWFESPEEATKYLETLLGDLSNDVQIANEDDEEISIDELSKSFDDYRKSQEESLKFRLVESIYDYITINLGCWCLQSDCDCDVDILTFTRNVMNQDKFIVRFYDGFDNEWMDITKPISKEEAMIVWNDRTKNGTKNTCYDDMDYYEIFPASTRMLYSSKEGRLDGN